MLKIIKNKLLTTAKATNWSNIGNLKTLIIKAAKAPIEKPTNKNDEFKRSINTPITTTKSQAQIIKPPPYIFFLNIPFM